eukprot:3991568-Alexandrium_andersonii.AAC.1
MVAERGTLRLRLSLPHAFTKTKFPRIRKSVQVSNPVAMQNPCALRNRNANTSSNTVQEGVIGGSGV